jgi:hypothetical protein
VPLQHLPRQPRRCSTPPPEVPPPARRASSSHRQGSTPCRSRRPGAAPNPSEQSAG